MNLYPNLKQTGYDPNIHHNVNQYVKRIPPKQPKVVSWHPGIFSTSIESKQVPQNIQTIQPKTHGNKLGFKVKEINKGIFVTHVDNQSPAALSGISFGDQILQINGIDVTGSTTDQIHQLLKSLNNNLKIALRKRPFERSLTLHKNYSGSLGFQFKDGMIYNLIERSSATRNGMLIHHQIVEINGQNVVGRKDEFINWLIENCRGPVNISIIPSFFYNMLINKDVLEPVTYPKKLPRSKILPNLSYSKSTSDFGYLESLSCNNDNQSSSSLTTLPNSDIFDSEVKIGAINKCSMVNNLGTRNKNKPLNTDFKDKRNFKKQLISGNCEYSNYEHNNMTSFINMKSCKQASNTVPPKAATEKSCLNRAKSPIKFSGLESKNQSSDEENKEAVGQKPQNFEHCLYGLGQLRLSTTIGASTINCPYEMGPTIMPWIPEPAFNANFCPTRLRKKPHT